MTTEIKIHRPTAPPLEALSVPRTKSTMDDFNFETLVNTVSRTVTVEWHDQQWETVLLAAGLLLSVAGCKVCINTPCCGLGVLCTFALHALPPPATGRRSIGCRH